jgi:AraC family L-rhamnose operon regulatory protein RhaS
VERVTAGSVYFSLPWERHGSVDEFEPGHYWHWVQFLLTGCIDRPRTRFGFHEDLGIPSSLAGGISARLTGAGHRCYPATARAAWLIPTLIKELSQPDRGDPHYVSALGRLAILELVRCIETADDAQATDASSRRVEALVQRLRQECSQPWTLETMAAACDLGRSRFATLCRRLTGDSPVELINRLRIDRAKVLLRETGHSITDIAHECGFGSSQYFARVFRSFTGMDARSYRTRHVLRSLQ